MASAKLKVIQVEPQYKITLSLSMREARALKAILMRTGGFPGTTWRTELDNINMALPLEDEDAWQTLQEYLNGSLYAISADPPPYKVIQ